jgi:hypothetical protein
MVIIPAKFKLAAIVSVAVISVSAGVVSDESERLDGVQSGYRVAACLPRKAVCYYNSDCCSGSCNWESSDRQRECGGQ